MRTQILLNFILFVFLTSLNAQDLRWHHHFYSKEYYRNMLSTLDPDANFYTAGYIGGPNEIDTVLGNYLANPEKGQFLYKVDSTGQPLWAKMILRGNVKVQSLESDPTGNLFVAGFFTGTVDFDPGPANNTATTLVERMYFLQKLDSEGNLIWAKQFDTSNPNGVENVTTLDPEGNILVAGIFYKTVDFDPGSGIYNQTIADDQWAGFFLKLDNDGNFLWVKQVDYLNFISTVRSDHESNWILFGNVYFKTDMDTGQDTFCQESGNFILKLNSQGEFKWVQPFSINPPEISVDAAGNIFMVDSFKDTVDFDPGPGEAIHIAVGGEQAYIMKWNSEGKFKWVRIDPRTPDGLVVSKVAAPGPNGSVTAVGYHYGHINVNPDLGDYWLDSGLSNVGLIIQTFDAAGHWRGEMHVSYLNDVFNKRDYFLRYDAKGDLYVRTTCSGTVEFDIDTSNIQYFTTQLQTETDQLLFKVTVPNVPQVSGTSNLNTTFNGVLFPNPATDLIHLQLNHPIESLQLFDALGLEMPTTVFKEGEDQITLSIANLPLGMYVLNLRAGDQVWSGRFVKI